MGEAPVARVTSALDGAGLRQASLVPAGWTSAGISALKAGVLQGNRFGSCGGHGTWLQGQMRTALRRKGSSVLQLGCRLRCRQARRRTARRHRRNDAQEGWIGRALSRKGSSGLGLRCRFRRRQVCGGTACNDTRDSQDHRNPPSRLPHIHGVLPPGSRDGSRDAGCALRVVRQRTAMKEAPADDRQPY